MKKVFTLFVLVYAFSNAMSQGVPILTFTNVGVTGLSSPVDIVNAADGTNRIFIVQRGGTIRVYDANYNLLNSNFLTISTNFTTGSERGLLSLVFHPAYETNRYFFVYYTNGAGGVNVDRFQTLSTDPNTADASTRTNLFTIPKPGPTIFANHNGGKLNFGADGHLYFGLGDAGSSGDPNNLSQNGNSLWGKMVRINVDNFTTFPYYTIPADNPFIADPLVSDSIYNIGLRNPWRWSFDRLTGDMWIGDVGQNAREEINSVPAANTSGVNYGWRCYEGLQSFNTTGCLPQSSYTSPVFEYPRNNLTGGFSVTGGYVYRGTLYPLLYGYYICSDYVSGNSWVIKENSPGNFTSTIQNGSPVNISGFGETENGELMAITLGGNLFTVSSLSTLPVRIEQFSASKNTATSNKISFKTSNEDDIQQYDIETSNDGIVYGTIKAITPLNVTDAQYSHIHYNLQYNKNYYRIKMTHKNGSITYSSIVSVLQQLNDEIKITSLTKSSIALSSKKTLNELQMYSATGKLIHSIKNISATQATFNIVGFNQGIYFIKVLYSDGSTGHIQFLL